MAIKYYWWDFRVTIQQQLGCKWMKYFGVRQVENISHIPQAFSILSFELFPHYADPPVTCDNINLIHVSKRGPHFDFTAFRFWLPQNVFTTETCIFWSVDRGAHTAHIFFRLIYLAFHSGQQITHLNWYQSIGSLHAFLQLSYFGESFYFEATKYFGSFGLHTQRRTHINLLVHSIKSGANDAGFVSGVQQLRAVWGCD